MPKAAICVAAFGYELIDMNKQLLCIPSLLLEWYRKNARDLPWRKTTDPYRIWISEIMLQQTRVAAVLGYYERFLAAFPDVFALASAQEEQLLKLWEGLGYYSRARNLQRAAKVIVNEYNGHIPGNYDELLALPGIGEYTAGAIASAAFGLRVPAVDGNVLRVMSRVLENDEDITNIKTKKQYRAWLTEILPDDPSDMKIFNQAMMELGATVCVPNGAPKCDLCPIQEYCLASKHGTTAGLPVKTAKKSRKIEEKTVFLLLRDDCIALRKREENGLLAGLWEFPNIDSSLDEYGVSEFVKDLGLQVVDWKKQLKAKHIFTHIEWHMTCYVLEVRGCEQQNYVWANRQEFHKYAIPSAFLRFTKEAIAMLEKTS